MDQASAAIGRPVRIRRSALDRGRRKVQSALAALCESCGEKVAVGAVTSGVLQYCSVECARTARDWQIPGNFLG